jgi:hypothetical protein
MIFFIDKINQRKSFFSVKSVFLPDPGNFDPYNIATQQTEVKNIGMIQISRENKSAKIILFS